MSRIVTGLGILTFAGAVTALPMLSAPSSVQFPSGTVQMGVIVTNVSGAPIALTALSTSGGPPAFPALGHFILGFPMTTCNPGLVMPPGGTCVVNYQYVQIAPGANSEPVSITMLLNAGASFETMLVNLVADAPDAPAIIPTLSAWLLPFLAGLISIVAVASIRRKDA